MFMLFMMDGVLMLMGKFSLVYVVYLVYVAHLVPLKMLLMLLRRFNGYLSGNSK